MAYAYAPDRKAARPIAHLAGFRGVLQVDGYAGYKVLAERGEVRLAFCWSHVRRHFYELAQSGAAPIASEALRRIADLYRIEADIPGRSADERRSRCCGLGRGSPQCLLWRSVVTWVRRSCAGERGGSAMVASALG